MDNLGPSENRSPYADEGRREDVCEGKRTSEANRGQREPAEGRPAAPEQVKLLPSIHVKAFRRDLRPPAQSFYERELGPLTRPDRKGNAKGNCRFHRSRSGKSFSVNLESGAFYCFGCGVHGGDIIDFVRLRDHCDFRTACKVLGCWQGVSKEERLKLDNEADRRKQERERTANLKQVERTQRLNLRDEIHTLVEIQAEVSNRLSQLLRGAAPVYENEIENCWSVASLVLDDLRTCECSYMALIGMEYAE